MNAFTLDIFSKQETNDIVIDRGVKMMEFLHKEVPKIGISLGNFGEDSESQRFFRFYDVEVGETLNFVDVANPDKYKMRCGAKPKDHDLLVDQDSTQAFIYVNACDPDTKFRFVNSSELRKDGLLIEGRISKKILFKNKKTKADEEKIVFSCPSILLACTDEAYSFKYWNGITKTMREVTIRFNGSHIEIIDNREIKFKKRHIGGTGSLGHKLNDAFNKQARDTHNNKSMNTTHYKKERRNERDRRNRERTDKIFMN